MQYGFGVDVGGTSVKLAFFDREGTMLNKWEIPTDRSENGKNILADIAASIRGYLAEYQIPQEKIIGIGVGVPGPVSDDGIVNKCVNLGWDVTDLHGELERLSGLRVKGGNDANVAAVGECWKGGGAGSRNMVLATLGTGIGGGVVVGGKLVVGAHGAGGEQGHIVVNPEETETCGCGNQGCIEQYGSATGAVRLAKRYLAAHDTPSVLRELADIQCRDVFDAAKDGDMAAMAILEQYFDLMGRFVATVCAIVDPEVVVLGGGVSKAGQMLIDGVRKYFLKYAFHACRNTDIVLAKLGNDAGAYGAFKLALDEFGG